MAVWHSEKENHYHEEMEDALQKGFPVPDEAAIRERVLRKDVEVPGSRYSIRLLPVSCGHK